MWGRGYSHILERGDEDVAERDDLEDDEHVCRSHSEYPHELTFSCLRCLSSLSSR
jgi:hypothetical protein